MPVVVSSVSVGRVATAGRTQIEVVGTGFRQQTVAPASGAGPTPAPPPSVRVFFGDVEALRVRVASPTRLLVTTPPRDAGTVDVRVENVDDFGAFLESGTLADAVVFALPLLTGDGDIVRIVRRLIRLLKQQVIPEVVLTSSVDWDDAPEAAPRAAAIAKVPALYLTGPTFRTSDGVNAQTTPIMVTSASGAVESVTPRTVDLVFGIGIVAESFIVTANLAQAATSFAVRNRQFVIARDAEDASLGDVVFNLDLEADFDLDSTPNGDGLYSGSASIAIKAVDIVGMPSFDGDLVSDLHPPVVDDVSIGSEQA